MKNFIKLTLIKSITRDLFVYININHIGDFREVKEKINYGVVEKIAHTNIGVLTHNNGGFEVYESAKEIEIMINKLTL